MTEAISVRSLWAALLAFLRRDIRSLFGKRIPESVAESSPAPLLAPHDGKISPTTLLDPAKLGGVRRRRKVLDWRDETIVNADSAGIDAFQDFSVHVQDLLKDVSIWRLLWAKPANEVLRVEFDKRVRLHIRKEMRTAEKRLAELLTLQDRSDRRRPSFVDDWPDRDLTCIAKHGFRPNNEDEILSCLRGLVMSNQGIVPMFQRQTISIADELIGKVAQ